MQESIEELACDELLRGGEGGADGLLDRWISFSLDGEQFERVAAHLMSCTGCRDEVEIGQAVYAGVVEGATGRSLVVESIKVAARWVSGALQNIALGLQPMVQAGVATRSAALVPIDELSYPVSALGVGSVLTLRAAANERFGLTLVAGDGAGDDCEYVLEGAAGRRVADSTEAVQFRGVAAGTWTLSRVRGEQVLAQVELQLTSD